MKSRRGYYRFPWRARARHLARFLHDSGSSYREIGIALFRRNLVHHEPDPATVRRMLADRSASPKGGAL
jgi:hypothetical protein